MDISQLKINLELRRDPQNIGLNHIRYISQASMGFSPILNAEGVFDDFSCLPAGDGLYIIAVAATKKGDKIDWAHLQNPVDYNIFPLLSFEQKMTCLCC